MLSEVRGHVAHAQTCGCVVHGGGGGGGGGGGEGGAQRARGLAARQWRVHLRPGQVDGVLGL